VKKILFILFLLPILSQAQKIESDKTDEFEGFRAISTSLERLTKKGIMSYPFLQVSVTKYMDKKDTMISISFLSKSLYVTSTDKDSEIMIKLKSGKIIKLKNEGSYDIVSSSDFFTMYSSLSEEDITVLTSEPVEKIRLSTSDSNIDIEIDEKNQGMIKKLVLLIKDYKL